MTTIDIAAKRAEANAIAVARPDGIQSTTTAPADLAEALQRVDADAWGTTPKAPLPVRLLRKLETDANGCWLWTSTLDRSGYGRMRIFRGPNLLVHRAVYEQLVGPIPDGLALDHLCKVRRCANPAHLEPVTAAENVRRSDSAKATRIRAGLDFCKRGHARTAENTRTKPDGTRYCWPCTQERSRLQYQGRSESPFSAHLHRVARFIRDEDLPPAHIRTTPDRDVYVDLTGTELVENGVRRYAAAVGAPVTESPYDVTGYAATRWTASGWLDGSWWFIEGYELLPTATP